MTNHPTTDVASEVTNRSHRLAELLNFEIQRIQAESARPGWTRWALLGALATSAWLALAEAKSRRVDLPKALLVALVLHLLYDLLIFGSVTLTASQDATPGTRIRFRFSSFLGQGRVYIIANFARYAAFLGIAIGNPLVPPGWLTAAVYAVPSFTMGILVLAVVLSFVHIPLPDPPSKTPMPSLAINLIAFAVIAIALGHLSRVLFATLSPADIPNVRVGVLITVFSILACLLAREKFQPPLLVTLIDVRRQLGLDELDYETARKQTALALKGMTVSDIFQEQAKQILEYWRATIVANESARSQISALRSSLASKDPTDYGEQEEAIVNGILTSVDTSLDEAIKVNGRAREQTTALRKRILRIRVFAPHAWEDLRGFLNDLDVSIYKELKKVEKLTEETRDHTHQLSELVRAAKSAKSGSTS